jgi:hypothetical protein
MKGMKKRQRRGLDLEGQTKGGQMASLNTGHIASFPLLPDAITV